jgi:hypothetical protein
MSAFLAVLAIAWSFYVYFHPQAPTPPVTFSSYASSTHLFRINFPSGWAVAETLPSSPTPTPTDSAVGTNQSTAGANTPVPDGHNCTGDATPVAGVAPVIGNVPCVVSVTASALAVAAPEYVDEGVLFVSPDLQSELAVWTGGYTPTERDLTYILGGFISTVNGRDPGPSGFGTRTVNGATWETLSTLFTRVNAEESATVCYTRRGGTSYYVLWSAPSTREHSDRSAYFDPMLSSLTFQV